MSSKKEEEPEPTFITITAMLGDGTYRQYRKREPTDQVKRSIKEFSKVHREFQAELAHRREDIEEARAYIAMAEKVQSEWSQACGSINPANEGFFKEIFQSSPEEIRQFELDNFLSDESWTKVKKMSGMTAADIKEMSKTELYLSWDVNSTMAKEFPDLLSVGPLKNNPCSSSSNNSSKKCDNYIDFCQKNLSPELLAVFDELNLTSADKTRRDVERIKKLGSLTAELGDMVDKMNDSDSPLDGDVQKEVSQASFEKRQTAEQGNVVSHDDWVLTQVPPEFEVQASKQIQSLLEATFVPDMAQRHIEEAEMIELFKSRNSVSEQLSEKKESKEVGKASFDKQGEIELAELIRRDKFKYSVSSRPPKKREENNCATSVKALSNSEKQHVTTVRPELTSLTSDEQACICLRCESGEEPSLHKNFLAVKALMDKLDKYVTPRKQVSSDTKSPLDTSTEQLNSETESQLDSFRKKVVFKKRMTSEIKSQLDSLKEQVTKKSDTDTKVEENPKKTTGEFEMVSMDDVTHTVSETDVTSSPREALSASQEAKMKRHERKMRRERLARLKEAQEALKQEREEEKLSTRIANAHKKLDEFTAEISCEDRMIMARRYLSRRKHHLNSKAPEGQLVKDLARFERKLDEAIKTSKLMIFVATHVTTGTERDLAHLYEGLKYIQDEVYDLPHKETSELQKRIFRQFLRYDLTHDFEEGESIMKALTSIDDIMKILDNDKSDYPNMVEMRAMLTKIRCFLIALFSFCGKFAYLQIHNKSAKHEEEEWIFLYAESISDKEAQVEYGYQKIAQGNTPSDKQLIIPYTATGEEKRERLGVIYVDRVAERRERKLRKMEKRQEQARKAQIEAERKADLAAVRALMEFEADEFSGELTLRSLD